MYSFKDFVNGLIVPLSSFWQQLPGLRFYGTKKYRNMRYNMHKKYKNNKINILKNNLFLFF